jgi:hypothetical protein
VTLRTQNGRNSFNFVAFEDKPVTLALSGLWGCTTVFVMSKRGAWMGHFWERYFKFTFYTDHQEFIYEVLAAMDIGDVYGDGVPYQDKYGIRSLRDNDELGAYGHLFDDDTAPNVVILAPTDRVWVPDLRYASGGYYSRSEEVVAGPAYWQQNEQLSDNVWLIFGEDNEDVTVQQQFYSPMAWVAADEDRDPGDDGYNTHRGKVLIQYQPAPRECDITSPEQRVAKYRYFIEGRQIGCKFPSPRQPGGVTDGDARRRPVGDLVGTALRPAGRRCAERGWLMESGRMSRVECQFLGAWLVHSTRYLDAWCFCEWCLDAWCFCNRCFCNQHSHPSKNQLAAHDIVCEHCRLTSDGIYAPVGD